MRAAGLLLPLLLGPLAVLAEEVPPPPSSRLGGLYLDTANVTACHDVCFGGFAPLVPGVSSLIVPTLPLSERGLPAVLDGGIVTVSPTQLFTALPDLMVGNPAIANLTDKLFIAGRSSRSDSALVKMVTITRGDGWPAHANKLGILISQLEWGDEGGDGGTLYALLLQFGQPPGVEPAWGGYCAIDAETGKASWLGDFPVKESLVMVEGGTSGYADGVIYSAFISSLGKETVVGFQLGPDSRVFKRVGTWVVGGLGTSCGVSGWECSLGGVGLVTGLLPRGHTAVAVVNPVHKDTGVTMANPVLLSLTPLPGKLGLTGNVTQLFDFGPFTTTQMLECALGGVAGGGIASMDGTLSFLGADKTLPTPPWGGDRADLVTVNLLTCGKGEGHACASQTEITPTFTPDSFGALVTVPPVAAAAPAKGRSAR